MMNTSLSLFDKTLTLYQYPKERQHKSWQAWDSADEYIIQHITDNYVLTPNTRLAIFNDEFGALGCWFKDQSIQWVSDSFIAQKAFEQNLALNGFSPQSINYIRSIETLTAPVDFVLLKVPKANALLEQQLIDLQKIVTNNTIVLAAGKAQAIHKSTLALFEKYLGPTTTSLAKKKSRLIFCTPTGDRDHPSPYPTVWKQEQTNYTIHNLANVFSRQQLDIGARFFLQHIPSCHNLDVIDLGCGNGVIGLNVLAQGDINSLEFVDESTMAIESARLNVQRNMPEQEQLCTFTAGNCLAHIKQAKAGLVLCNPPFHQQNTITEHIAKQMFSDAKRALRPRGELRIVCNRHLGYFNVLKKHFGNCRVVASNKKFSILSAIKKG